MSKTKETQKIDKKSSKVKSSSKVEHDYDHIDELGKLIGKRNFS